MEIMPEDPIEKVGDYLASRILEHGSMSAYCLALVGAYDETLPKPARWAIFIAATYKFLKPG